MADDDVREFELGSEPDEGEVLQPWQSAAWTAQEVAFISGVLQHGNATRAYVAAVPSFTGNRLEAGIRAGRLLRRPHIKGYVEFVRAQMAAAMVMTPDEVLAELTHIGRANMSDFVVIQEDGGATADLSNLTREQAAAISEITIETYVEKGGANDGRSVRSVKFKLAPKTPALELLGKKHKLFTDIIENHGLGDVADTLRTRRQASTRAAADKRADAAADKPKAE